MTDTPKRRRSDLDPQPRPLVGNQLVRMVLRMDDEGSTVQEIAEAAGMDPDAALELLVRLRR